MAVETVTRRIIELDVKTSGDAIRAMKQQAQAMKDFESTVKGVQDSIKNFAIGFASAFSVGMIVEGIKSAIDEMDKMNEAAARLGMSVSDLQEWNHAASMSGVSAEQFAGGVNKLNKALGDMGDSTADTTKILKQFGVTATDTADQALTKLAEGFSKMEDGPKKAALAMAIFGKAGADMLPLLNEGADSIATLRKEAHELGIVYSDEAAAAAAQFGDSMERLQKVSKGIMIQLAEGVLPALNAITESLLDGAKEGEGFKDVGIAIGKGMIWVAEQVYKAVGTIQALGKLLGGIGAIAAQLLTGQFSAAWGTAKEVYGDINQIEAQVNTKIQKLRANYEEQQRKLKETAKAPPKPPFEAPKLPGKDVKKEKDALEEYIKTLQHSLDMVGRVNEVQKAELFLKEKGIALDTEKAKKVLEVAAALDKSVQATNDQKLADELLVKAKENLAKAQKEEQDQIEKWLDMADPWREITREYEKLNAQIEKTADPELRQKLERVASVFEQNIAKAFSKSKNEADQYKTALEALGETLKQEIEGFSKDAADAIVEFAATGKTSVGDMVNSILKDLARLAVKRAMDPLFEIAGKAVGDYFKYGTAANGAAFGPSGPITAFATGGVVGGPTFFGMAGGGVGLMGEAGGEAVAPLRRDKSGKLGVSSAPVSVTVVNNNGSDIKVEETESPQGEKQVQIMVDSAVERSIGKGRFDRVLSTSYGISRRGR